MGALRLYGRGWAKIGDYSGTATRSEFWTFTVINAVLYVVASMGAVWLFTFVTADWLGRSEMSDIFFFYFFSTIFVIFALTVIVLAPWTSLFVRRVRDATGSSIAALVLVLIAYAGLIAVPLTLAASLVDSHPLAPVFLSLAALAFLAVAVVSALPSREV